MRHFVAVQKRVGGYATLAAMNHLDIIIKARRVFVGVITLLCGIAHWGGLIDLPISQLLIILLGVGVLDLIWHFSLSSERKQTPLIILSHLVCDVLFLTLFLGLTGGAMSPFTSLYLIPIIFGAILLPYPLIWLLLAVTVGGYTGIAYLFRPMMFFKDSPLDMMTMHFGGMMLSFLLVSGLMTIFVVKLTQNIRKKEQALDQMQTTLLIEAQFAKMGVIAASAAHDINTPLNTLFLLQDSWGSQNALEKNELALMEQQLQRISLALQKAIQGLGVFQAGALENLSVAACISGCCDAIRHRYPDRHITVNVQGNEIPGWTPHPYFSEIINNLVENSAKVANKIDLEVQVDTAGITMQLQDNGPGFDPQFASELNANLLHQMQRYTEENIDKNRHGLGLILTQFLVNRLGGKIQFSKNKVTVWIPQS